MSTDPRLFQIDLKNMATCLACPFPECGYLLSSVSSVCPIIRAEISYKTSKKREYLTRKKTQSIQLVEA